MSILRGVADLIADLRLFVRRESECWRAGHEWSAWERCKGRYVRHCERCERLAWVFDDGFTL